MEETLGMTLGMRFRPTSAHIHYLISDGNKVLLSVRSFFAKQKIAPAGAPQAVFLTYSAGVSRLAITGIGKIIYCGINL